MQMYYTVLLHTS